MSEHFNNISDVKEKSCYKMLASAENALKYVLSLDSKDRMLVITDEEKRDIGKVFHEGAIKLGAKSDLYTLSRNLRPLEKIPSDLKPLFRNFSVFINAFEAHSEETPFRVKLLQSQIKYGARIGHAPGITKEMLIFGAMQIDHEKIRENAKRLMKTLDDAEWITITTPKGTNLKLNVKNRYFQTDVEIKPGKLGNLPTGEVWCAPIENSGEGMIIVDGSIGDIGPIKEIMKIDVKKGKIVDLECKDIALLSTIKKLISVDEMASVVGELGIGLNPKARLTGNIVEAEKASGTAHIGFGYNVITSKGKNNSVTHRDFLFYKPTIKVKYKDGKEKVVIQDGIIH